MHRYPDSRIKAAILLGLALAIAFAILSAKEKILPQSTDLTPLRVNSEKVGLRPSKPINTPP